MLKNILYYIIVISVVSCKSTIEKSKIVNQDLPFTLPDKLDKSNIIQEENYNVWGTNIIKGKDGITFHPLCALRKVLLPIDHIANSPDLKNIAPLYTAHELAAKTIAILHGSDAGTIPHGMHCEFVKDCLLT